MLYTRLFIFDANRSEVKFVAGDNGGIVVDDATVCFFTARQIVDPVATFGFSENVAGVNGDLSVCPVLVVGGPLCCVRSFEIKDPAVGFSGLLFQLDSIVAEVYDGTVVLTGQTVQVMLHLKDSFVVLAPEAIVGTFFDIRCLQRGALCRKDSFFFAAAGH